MLHPLLEKYIPSQSYVRYLQETGASFTEFETAAILHHIGLPVETEIKAYRALLGETADEELRRQLSEEISRLERSVELFKTGGTGIAYLICERTTQEEIIALAANYETAYELGVHSGVDFRIQKYRLLTEYSSQPVLRKYYINPILSHSGELSDCVKTWEDAELSREIGKIGRFTFRKDGTLLSVDSDEAEDQLSDEEHLRRSFASDSFTNAYIDYPNPFECGDLVTFVSLFEAPGTDNLGIVRESQEEWENFRQRVKEGLEVDQFDASLTVEWLTEDGRFSHEHHAPVFLERREIGKSDPRYEVIAAGRNLLRGRGGLEWFGICMENYQRWLHREKCASAEITQRRTDMIHTPNTGETM